MPRFTLNFRDGTTGVVDGETISDACRIYNHRPVHVLADLQNYTTEDGQEVPVAGIADCGCFYHAERGEACRHDLEKAGIITASDNGCDTDEHDRRDFECGPQLLDPALRGLDASKVPAERPEECFPGDAQRRNA